MAHWRSKAFYLTRNRNFLMKGVVSILGVFIAVAVSVYFIFSVDATRDANGLAITPADVLRQSYKVLLSASDKSPEHLIAWLKEAASQRKQMPPAQRAHFNEEKLQSGKTDIRALIEHHVSDPVQRELFFNYSRCIFANGNAAPGKAREALRERADATPATRYTNEFHADLLVLENKPEEALHYYLRETVHPDAIQAHLMAARLALTLEDTTALDQLTKNKDFITSCSSSMLLKMAGLLDDKVLLIRGLATMQWDRLSRFTGLSIALFSAVLWHLILTTSAGLRMRQAFNYIPAILAGMLSVWLLHSLQVLFQYDARLDFESELPAMQQIYNWVMYVGVPEEAVKLCLFSPWLPFLLARRSREKAALAAGCVGLGFALNENLQYYQDYGVTIAIARLLTANIIHISLTGILGYELYLLFESRFHRAVDFLLTFGAVALAHGLYDFCNSDTTIDGLELGSIIIVAFSARWYLQRLHSPHNNSNQPVSRTSIFCLGSSLLVGALMVIAVIDAHSLTGITMVLKDAIGLATVALIYVREFKEI